MKTFYWGFEILASAIDSFTLMYFVEHFVGGIRKDRNVIRGRLVFFLLLTVLGVFSINNNFFWAEMGTGIIYLNLLLYGFLYAVGSKREIFIVSSIIYVLLGLINTLVPLVINYLTGKTIASMMDMGSGSTRIMVLFICKIIYFFINILILNLFKHSSFKLNKGEWAVLSGSFSIIMMIVIVLFIIVRTQSFSENIGILIIAVNLGLFALLVALYLMMIQLNKAHEKQLEYERIALNQNNQKKLLEDREKEYEQLQIVRHDIKNYLSTLIGMLQNGKTKEAIEYVNIVLEERIETIWEVVDVGDATLNAVINTKFTICRKKGICCESTIIGNLIFENPVNIGIILSNLLDNAMEACEKMTKNQPRIVISCAIQKGYLDLCVKNTIKESVLEDNPSLKTTKKEKEFHGYGIKSIKKILEEEGGMISQSEKNGWFITHIFLPIKHKRDMKEVTAMT